MTDHDYHNGDINQLIGKTMRSVVRNGNQSIAFEADTGERWSMHYEPDCCASCDIEDVVGDLNDLVGSPIVMAEVATNSTDGPSKNDEYPDSYTWTFYKFATAKGYVTVRWYGSSNGYYSETASFRRRLDIGPALKRGDRVVRRSPQSSHTFSTTRHNDNKGK